MTPIKNEDHQQTRANSVVLGKRTQGSSAYKEVAGATLSFYDLEGDRLPTRCKAPMQKLMKLTLKSPLTAELDSVLKPLPKFALHKGGWSER